MTPKRKYAIYTAIFGAYDELREPANKAILEEADFFCFTDDASLQSSRIQVIQVERLFEDPTRCARYYKIMEHPVLSDYEWTIWIDANYVFEVASISAFRLDRFENTPLITFRHSAHHCLYDQALVCIYAYNDHYYKILGQIIRYALAGMPVNFGLYETGILIKNKAHPKLGLLQQMWWQEVNKGSRRDQISLPYCLWKLNLQIGILEGFSFKNTFTTYLFRHRLTDPVVRSRAHKIVAQIEKKTPYLRLYSSRLAKIIKFLRT